MAQAYPEVIPGTVHLVDSDLGDGNDIELIPRPSDDPEDPLNWSKRRKYLSATMVLVYTLGVGLPVTLQYSVLADITQDTGVRLGTPIESPVSSPSIWPRPARERHSRPPVQLQQSAIERPVMERRDFELPDPDWMRDLSHCPLSDRDKELLEKFWTELENDRMEHCARCQETWFDMGLKGGICKRCIARDKNKKEDEPWFFSAENQLDFGLIPAFLPQLTIVEEMLIARVHVFVNVMQVRGQQYKYRGHIVHFLRDVGKVYSQLPLLPPELDVILLRPPTASEHAHLNRQFRRQFRVRRRCLQEWLNFLSNNHPGYRGITVCQKRMSVLPEDGDVLDQVATAAVTDPLSANLGNIENDDVEPDEVDQSAVPDLLPEDTEMEALRSHVLGEERGEHLPVRPSTQHQLEMPDIRRTPINEFNHSQALLSLAFPTLFPRGQADFVEPRLRPIKYADYIQHALRWHDGRFARHPTFRFVVFNTLMRAQARAKSSYFVKEYQQRQGLITRDDLLEAFQNPESAEAQQLLNSINRQTAQLRGTRPYWYRKRRELESYAYNLDCPGAFITFSPADLHWRSLYQHLPQFQDWQELPEQQRMGMSSKLLRDNPHIAAWHFYRRFGLFRDIVLKQKFNVTDYWNRYEWQGRGSSHCHGLFWMDGAPSVDLENEHLRKEFARIWRFHVTAFNPEPARVRQQGEGNPLAVNPLQHPLTFQWLSQVLNRCQRHHCSETYCLRKKKGSEEISCRFFFPRDTRDTADVVRRQGQSYFSFEAARNDSLMNHYNRCLSLGWLANIDISPCTSLQAVINYAAKYCSKMEKRTDSYASMGRQILPYVSHQNPLLSFASRLMNKLLTERDFSGQEICHVLLNCELQEGTRVIRAVDCRPYEQQGRSLRLQGDHDDAEVVGIYEKYLSRPPLHEELTYLDFLANWNTSKRDGRKWTRWSRQAKPRVLYYFPRYKSNHQHHQYDDFCRVKLMLAHPHRDPNELRKINGVEYNSYASAAEFCYGNHRHPDDYYGTPNAEERRPDPDEFEEEFHEPDLLEEDWLELARQLPDCPPSQEAIDLLGRRDIDIQYDWTPHVGRYADPGIVQGDYWRQRIEQNRLYMDVEDMPLEVRDALNPEQRIVYDTFIGHFQCGSEEQILLHVDGGGGTGKSYMIKVLSSHLQRLAGNRPSPIWRAAPTGVASNQIMGTTLHSLLRLPMDRAFTELSPADANAIQKKLRDVRYLVIDEKSMLGLRQLSWIDKRLRQVFPARAAEFFGGISIILVGDFFQLPPIANKPLYFDGPLKDLHEVSGQTAYRAFNHTVFLKKVQRQQGDDQAGFRLALEELRGLKLSIESWKLLSQRVQVKLSQREEDTFDAALRIYSKKARVNEYNYEHLVRLKHPAIQVMAKNIGNGVDKATSEQAGNLAGQFPPAGLVNGAQGTVYDIGWAPGADAHRDPPSVIMMVMDKGTWMSLYVFTLFGSNFLAPLVAGFFADAYGWRWTMHFGAIFAAFSFLILFLFMEETIYFRPTFEGLEDQVQPTKGEGEDGGESGNLQRAPTANDKKITTTIGNDQEEGTVHPKKSLTAHLVLFVKKDGRPNKKNMFKSMLAPLPLMVLFPNVAWAGFIYGINLCWYNVLNATTSPILSTSPYNWSTSMVGLMYVGPIIGAALGCLWSGIVADRIALSLARRNNGIREPEHRLWPLALSALLSCVGLIVWGVGADKHIPWIGLAIGLVVLTFSCVTGGSIALSYNVDCFKDISGDTTTSIIIIRNTLGFAISYGITPWYVNMGLQDCFIMAGLLSLGCTSTFLLMIWKGKSLRRKAAPRYWQYVQNMVYQ
ncbi:hypothetical protein HZS61_007812 [Fusarium oxysporum f. sp. conglutinans]|uniref:ATP-dependent DNA helicase n=1 Tax=Fusarium oxysporum f. sp. conglutinans TaxID=100902 RepID=A0A8H6LQY5_FUSOX|nr:hypothetical protein HZS61_015958 [Fusarium oxysporum f. sp. conglutinans]KAF6527510.1 hypothetical protein HZS61_007812 [Fusarium oxysporum f. sp. conglutinans]